MAEFSLVAVLKILMLDIVLSGDNAVVIAMASRTLPPAQQKKAIFFGGAGAILLRIVATALVAILLVIPFLQFVGGLMLLVVAVKLLKGGDEESNVKAGASLKDAIFTIILADFVMSLDNMLAVGGASHGSIVLLMSGLVLSMGIIMFSSTIIAKLMNRYGWLVYVGAGILGWTAGEMILGDKLVHRYFAPSLMVERIFLVAITAAVLIVGYISSKRAESAQAEIAAEKELGAGH